MIKQGKEKMKSKLFFSRVIILIVLAVYFLPAKAIEGRLLVTTAPNFFDRWYKCPGEMPMAHIPPTLALYKKQAFYVLPMISNFAIRAGKPSIYYNLYIKNKKDTVVRLEGLLGLDKIVNDTTAVFLAESIRKLEFGDRDPDGFYEIAVVLTDNVAHESVTLTSLVSVEKYNYKPAPFAKEDSFFLWQNYYYEGLEPNREIDGLLYFAKPDMQTQAEATLPLLAFFEETFKSKTYLLNELEAIFSSRDSNERLTIIHILNLCGYMPATLQKKFSAKEKKYYEDLKGYGLPEIPADVLQNPVMINIVWCKYFATGDYNYAKKLAETMELAKYKGALKSFGESQKTEEDQKKAFLETVYKKSYDDLMTHLRNHPLINGYCKYMLLKRGEVSTTVAEELEILVVR